MKDKNKNLMGMKEILLRNRPYLISKFLITLGMSQSFNLQFQYQ